jgi:hypothetical protein
MLDHAVIQIAGFVGGGLLVILFTGVSVLRNGATVYAVAGFFVGAFLITAPLIKNLRVDKEGVSVETVAQVAKAAGRSAVDNAEVVVGLQKAIEEIRKQVEALAAQQLKLSAATSSPPPPDLAPSRIELNKAIQATDQLLKRSQDANRILERALGDIKVAPPRL